jgi:ribonucleoside-diphosphate reductase alpha chain
MKSPKNSIFVKDVTAIDQLNFWKMFQIFYCEHKPSCTIYVKPHEWIEVAAWVYKNMDLLSGVSFLPYSDHIYQQAPFEPISKEKYEELIKDIPKSIDWNQLINYEKEDYTVASQEYACSASGCELK